MKIRTAILLCLVTVFSLGSVALAQDNDKHGDKGKGHGRHHRRHHRHGHRGHDHDHKK